MTMEPLCRTGSCPETTPLDNILGKAIAELRKNPFSPEVNTSYWRAKLQADGKRMGSEIAVMDCNWTEEAIKKPMKDKEGNEVPSMLVYVPEELMGRYGLVRLGQMYPKMSNGNWSAQEGTAIQDSPDANKIGGWIKVEATVNAPNLDTSQGDLEKHAKKQEYSGQRVNTYILASQASKDLTGHYLDEKFTWSHLFGSRHKVWGVANARFSPDGNLLVDWNLGSRGVGENVGGRFEEVKKA